MKHIELNYNSLAECYYRAKQLLNISDLGHRTKIVIDIDTDSAFDGSWIQVADAEKGELPDRRFQHTTSSTPDAETR